MMKLEVFDGNLVNMMPHKKRWILLLGSKAKKILHSLDPDSNFY